MSIKIRCRKCKHKWSPKKWVDVYCCPNCGDKIQTNPRKALKEELSLLL